MALLMKICLLGDGSVGKTSLINRYLGKGFPSAYTPTLGTDFHSKEVSLGFRFQKKDIRFQIWDLAGQPAFEQVRKVYYHGSVGALLVFDLTRPDSFRNIERWVMEFSKNIGLPNSSIVVLGNKMDLKNEVKISAETVKQYIIDNLDNKYSNIDNGIKYFETSAKTGENVERAFSVLGRKIISRFEEDS
ncbi:MAG: Rab family GTPase [Promethearchaeota archaeon]